MQSHENKQTCCGSQEAAAERRRSLAPIVRTPRERRSSLLNCAICLTSISSAMKAGASSSHSCVRRKFLMLQWLFGGDHPPRIESSKKEQKGLNDNCNWSHNDDWRMTELFGNVQLIPQSCLTFWKCSTRPSKLNQVQLAKINHTN